MAPFLNKKVLFLLLLVFITSTFISAHSQHQTYSRRRVLLEIEDDEIENKPVVKKKSTTSTTSSGSGNKISTKKNNTTKLLKPTTIPNSSKNQTKLIKTTSLKNQTKLTKPSNSNSTSSLKSPQIKKLNTTSIPKKPTSDLPKTKPKSPQVQKPVGDPISKPIKAQKKPNWIDDDEDEATDDLVAEFRDLPSKFQESIMPDLEKLSETSRTYLTKYNKEFTKGFKPYVGNKYASSIASFVSFAFIIIPLILVSLLFHRIKAFFSLLKLLIFIQIYLAIYFTILCLSSLLTGLEPLKFFYSTSQSTYICVQVLQTLAYVLYLLLLLMFLVLVFSTETGMGTKMLGLGQMLVGFAVGLHYYMTVFHRAVLRQAPKTSWKVQGIYATCFLAVCLLGRVDRSKKAYLEEGGEEGKKS